MEVEGTGVSLKKGIEEKIIASVRDIGSEHGFQCYVVADSDGSIRRGGDCEGLKYSLLNTLFGGKDELTGVFAFLEGKMLPQFYRQGDVYCLLMKPAEDIVVGLFAQDGRSGISLYQEGREMAKALEQRLRSLES